MAQLFYNHSAQLSVLLRNTSELNAKQKVLLGNFVDGFLQRANISATSFQPAHITFFSYEECVDSSFMKSVGKKSIQLLEHISITFNKNAETGDYSAKVIYPLGYTTPPAKKKQTFYAQHPSHP